MRVLIRAGLAAAYAADLVACLCVVAVCLLYGLAWMAAWPFGAAARSLVALSRRITEGAPLPRLKGRAR